MKNEIVVGLDDSPSGQAALDWAAEHARSVGAVLRAVHVLDWPYGLSSAGFPAPANFMELSREEIEDSYRRAITAVFDAVSPTSDWTLHFASGDTGQVLVRQSKDARLLVVGTREHVGLGRLLTGSVSHYCLSHAVCPVVAVPAPGAGRREDSEIVAPATTAGTEQDLAAAIEATQRLDEEPEAAGTTQVVAGVDASAESLAAAHYAVSAAELRGGDVVLLHAFKPPSGRAADKESALPTAQKKADKLLTAVSAQLIVPPDLHLSLRAEPGDAVGVLKQSTRESAMLVLGRDHVSWGERLLGGAVTSQVVNHIACPLVVVPGRWRPRHAWPLLPVIVALDSETDPEPALRLAFQEARLRAARLIVLHAEPMSASARDVAAAQFDLGVVLAKWKQDHPEVGVSTAILSGDPDAHLVRWSRSAAVLVVGHPHRRGWADWTRSVARSVMRQTHCPLVVSPQAKAQGGRHRELADEALT
jgi:nucleotide-binding universal stress UspA family protein